jgi:hypothetical protein
MTDSKRSRRPPAADIEFVASIEAGELRFDESPETDVRFFGEPDHESTSGSDRTNLPEKVEPGVTYRKVRVDYRLATRLVEATSRARKPARGPRPNDRQP